MEGLLPLLRLRFSYCLASRLDTCQNSYSGRLNGSRASINGTGLRCVKNDFYAISIFRYKSSPLCRVIFKCSVRVLCVVPSGRLIAPGDPASDVGLFEWVQECRNLNAFRFVSAPIRMSQPPAVKSLSVLKIDGRKPTSWAQFATCSHQDVISCLL